jgi:hypothetical protein
MRRKQAQIDPAEAHANRLAWWAGFVTTIVFVLGLIFIHTAEAATPAAAGPGPIASTPLEFEFEAGEEEAEEGGEDGEWGWEEEWEGEECEAGEVEAWDEEEEEFECEPTEEDDAPPPQCRLESADAAVSADLVHRKLRLALRYTAARSTPVRVRYFLRGRRGPLTLPAERPRLGRGGVFRTARKLNPAQAKKVAAAKSFMVQVRPVGAPGLCHSYLDQSLTVRRGGHVRPMWIDTDSTFRHSHHA